MITALFGGIGHFDLGMVLLTEGPKAVVGDAFRDRLHTMVRPSGLDRQVGLTVSV